MFQDRTLEYKGAYIGTDKDDLLRKEDQLGRLRAITIEKGGFKQIFTGGYGGYAPLNKNGALVVMGYQAEYSDSRIQQLTNQLKTSPNYDYLMRELNSELSQKNPIETLLEPPSPIENVQFNYGAGEAKLQNGKV